MPIKIFERMASETEFVFTCTLHVKQVRALIGTDYTNDDLDTALDEAQGAVLADDSPVSFVVIKIIPDEPEC